MVKVAVPVTVDVPAYVAVTTGFHESGVTVVGTLRSPLELIVQPLLTEVWSIDQVTVAPLTPVTLALNCCVPPNFTAGFEGVTVTFVVAAEARPTKPNTMKAQTRIHASTANLDLFIISS
jgi:hypothetical protein